MLSMTDGYFLVLYIMLALKHNGVFALRPISASKIKKLNFHFPIMVTERSTEVHNVRMA